MALTAKQELFAQAVAVLKLNQTDAYSRVYDTSKLAPASVHTAASKLAHNEEVASRIAVLTERAAAVAVKKAGTSLADVLAKTETAIQNAQATGQVSAEVAAIKLQAQLSGHLVEKKADDKSALDQMDVDKLLLVKKEIDDRLQRAKDALDMCGDPNLATASAPVQMRRVIG